LDHSDGGPDLVQQVRVALTTALDAARVDGPRPSDTETLWEFFHRDGADFWSVRNRLVTPILILDQFEEAFTLARRSEAARQRVRDFSAELSALVDGRPPASVARRFEARPTSTEDFDFDRQACRIVLALREDFLPDFEALRGRYPAIGQNWFRLESLRGDRALEAVLEPGAGLVDQAAAIRIVDFVSTSRQRTARADEPPPLPEELANRRVQPAHLSIVCHPTQRTADPAGPAGNHGRPDLRLARPDRARFLHPGDDGRSSAVAVLPGGRAADRLGLPRPGGARGRARVLRPRTVGPRPRGRGHPASDRRPDPPS
jgi:hypothetical protein